MLTFDPDEHFEINHKKAKEANGIHYKGIKTAYIEDTNTLIFSLDKEKLNDEDDLSTIVYRNYDVNEIKQFIDDILKNYKSNESMEL